jgi:SAM-dependent methyltransferase
VLTIGRLNLYLSPAQIKRLCDRYGPNLDPAAFAKDAYADAFLKSFLNASKVASLDYSSYEGCDIVHDLNRPIDESHHQAFDAVIDGGTLEHVFQFPTAIASCMNMVKPGGSLFLFTMANNHLGHGFYQFSPELFFRIFQPENGFEVRDVILELHRYPGAELSRSTQCYSVVDPAAIRSRVGLVSRMPAMMMVHAVRTAVKPIFATCPIQSDYSAIYQGQPPASPADGGIVQKLKSIARACLKVLPPHVKQSIDGQRQLWHYSIKNRQFYKRWDPLQ